MTDKKELSSWEIAKQALIITNPLLGLVINTAEKAITKSEEITKSGSIQQISDEATRQELTLQMAEAQARVAQEVAIARRIDNAEEVEIEEFYDTAGEGSVGLKGSEQGVTVGLHGNGRRVSRRVYRFKGWREEELPKSKIDEV
jgi:uncharacterized protein (DUF1786 family)